MPTYGYRCSACQSAFELFARFADYQERVPCACGETADRAYDFSGIDIAVRGMAEYAFDPRKNARISGKWGKSAQQCEKEYTRVVETERQLVKARRSAGREKDGCEWLGTMPALMHDSIAAKEGDKNAVLVDPVPFLKATGTYMGKDAK